MESTNKLPEPLVALAWKKEASHTFSIWVLPEIEDATRHASKKYGEWLDRLFYVDLTYDPMQVITYLQNFANNEWAKQKAPPAVGDTYKPDLRFACYPPSDPANPIDWAQAPEWANWATYRRSSDYWIYWYAKKPKEDGTWAEGSHSREFHNADDQIVVEQRPS